MHPIAASINEQVHAPRLPRKVMRQFKQQAIHNRFRAGQQADPAKLEGIDKARAERAIEKRERKATKRVEDDQLSAIGARRGWERLNGHLV